ncbi:MAG TPA: hypothetical protein VN803_04060 [Gemmatimonadales bacterium]|nr:hypothetical protein [Gemmatimonadales bacterium]
MTVSYPHELIFDLPEPDPRRDAIAHAAATLHLPTAHDGSVMRVTVQTPQECYRFGQATGELLHGRVPMPVPPQEGPQS